MKISGAVADDLRPKVAIVNDHIADAMQEALDAEIEVMRLSRQWANLDGKDRVQAGGLCAATAKDLLDRGGASAPKRIESKNLNMAVDANSAQRILDALTEMD